MVTQHQLTISNPFNDKVTFVSTKHNSSVRNVSIALSYSFDIDINEEDAEKIISFLKEAFKLTEEN
jgi:hypothetical protein